MIGIGEMSRDLPMRDKPKRDVIYRCPWCNHITTNKEKARLHSLSCSKKTGTIWTYLNKLSKRELREIAKET